MIAIDYIWILDNKINTKTIFTTSNLKRYNDLDSYIGDLPRILHDKDFDKFPKDIINFNGEELLLIPGKIYKMPFLSNRYVILCEIYNKDNTPHILNERYSLKKKKSCKKIKITQTIKIYTVGNVPRDTFLYKSVINQIIDICIETKAKISNLYFLDSDTFNIEFNNNSITTNIDDLIFLITCCT